MRQPRRTSSLGFLRRRNRRLNLGMMGKKRGSPTWATTTHLANALTEHSMAHMGIVTGNSIGMIILPTVRHGLIGGEGRYGEWEMSHVAQSIEQHWGSVELERSRMALGVLGRRSGRSPMNKQKQYITELFYRITRNAKHISHLLINSYDFLNFSPWRFESSYPHSLRSFWGHVRP